MKRRDTIVRYTAPERINHWIVALLRAGGGGELRLFISSFGWLLSRAGTLQLARILRTRL